MCELCRRRFIRGAAALGVAGAAGLFSSPLMAQPRRGDAPASKLPARGEFTIANAHVMTMDAGGGEKRPSSRGWRRRHPAGVALGVTH
jgi:FtsP/CotA-like multicopper oxidase with cupredoxin domain